MLGTANETERRPWRAGNAKAWTENDADDMAWRDGTTMNKHVHGVATCGLLLLTALAFPLVARGAACPIVSIGLDTMLATNSAGSILGEPVIQTFLTPGPQTAIRSITVWRVASQAQNGYGIHLYIGKVDSTGFPIHRSPLLDGPTLTRVGDGVHPTAFRFEFDPPFNLPRSGKYFFALVPRGGYWDLLSARDAYPDGDMWGGSRTCCSLIGYPTPLYRPADLIFTIEFCATTICAQAEEGEAAVLECPEGYVVGSVEFASFGTSRASAAASSPAVAIHLPGRWSTPPAWVKPGAPSQRAARCWATRAPGHPNDLQCRPPFVRWVPI